MIMGNITIDIDTRFVTAPRL